MNIIKYSIVIFFCVEICAQKSNDDSAYNNLIKNMQNDIRLFNTSLSMSQNVIQRVRFKDSLLQIILLLKKPDDIIAYLKELALNVESLLRSGDTEASKELLQEMLAVVDELKISANAYHNQDEYRANPGQSLTSILNSPTYELSKTIKVIDVLQKGLFAFADILKIKANKPHSEEQAVKKKEESGKEKKIKELYSLINNNQAITFSNKKTTQNFIKNFKNIIAELYNINSSSITYLKRFIADLEGVINTGMSRRTENIVQNGIERLEKSIDEASLSEVEKNEWYIKLIHILKSAVSSLKLDYKIKLTDLKKEEREADTRSPREIHEQSKQSNSTSSQIAAHLDLVLAQDIPSYRSFFGKINQPIPVECQVSDQKSFEEQLAIIWPCKMKYINQIVKVYHPDLLQEIAQLDEIVLKLVLFMKNRNTMDSSRKKEKLDELKEMLDPLKNPKKQSMWSKLKSSLPGNKKNIQKMIDALKQRIIHDVDIILNNR